VFDAGDGLGGADPDALAEALLGKGVADLRDVQQIDDHVAGDAALVVEIAADRFGLEDPDQARLFPGLLQGDLAGRLAGFEAPLGDNPAFAVAAADQTDLPEPDRDGRRLLQSARCARYDRHRTSATRGETSL